MRHGTISIARRPPGSWILPRTTPMRANLNFWLHSSLAQAILVCYCCVSSQQQPRLLTCTMHSQQTNWFSALMTRSLLGAKNPKNPTTDERAWVQMASVEVLKTRILRLGPRGCKSISSKLGRSVPRKRNNPVFAHGPPSVIAFRDRH
jgi:hypothetical protein